MWWFVKKILDDSNTVAYAYGFESKKLSGEVSYNKSTQQFTLSKLADNDNQKIAERFLFRHLHRIITSENCPAERQIAIG